MRAGEDEAAGTLGAVAVERAEPGHSIADHGGGLRFIREVGPQQFHATTIGQQLVTERKRVCL